MCQPGWMRLKGGVQLITDVAAVLLLPSPMCDTQAKALPNDQLKTLPFYFAMFWMPSKLFRSFLCKSEMLKLPALFDLWYVLRTAFACSLKMLHLYSSLFISLEKCFTAAARKRTPVFCHLSLPLCVLVVPVPWDQR